jgi:hypothetical protein
MVDFATQQSQRRAHFDNLTMSIERKLGGDFDGRGLVRGIEETLAPFILGNDDVYLGTVEARRKGIPETRSTSLGKQIGELMGSAYLLGTAAEEIPHA